MEAPVTDPNNIREVASLKADGTMVVRDDATPAELRQVIKMLAGLYFEARNKLSIQTKPADTLATLNHRPRNSDDMGMPP
jgi:hypothetical protein